MKVTARVRRSAGWWAVDVPEVDGVFTQAKRLDQVAEQTADAVAVMLEVDPADVDVTIDAASVLDTAIEAQVEQARALAERAERTQREASAAMRAAVESLRGKVKLSVRDAGVLLGVSHQRVGQLEAKVSTSKQASSKKTPVTKGGMRLVHSAAASRTSAATAAASSPSPSRRAAKAATTRHVAAAKKSSAKPAAKKAGTKKVPPTKAARKSSSGSSHRPK